MNLGKLPSSEICSRFFQTTTKLLVRSYNGNHLFRSYFIRSLTNDFTRVVVSDVTQLSSRVRGISLKANCDEILKLKFKVDFENRKTRDNDDDVAGWSMDRYENQWSGTNRWLLDLQRS